MRADGCNIFRGALAKFHLPKPLHGWRALAGEVGITVCRWGTGRMHLHMPKPLHGWREFIHEFTIVVLGVLIALGANQMVENWAWSNKVRHAESAMCLELAEA